MTMAEQFVGVQFKRAVRHNGRAALFAQNIIFKSIKSSANFEDVKSKQKNKKFRNKLRTKNVLHSQFCH